MAKLSDYVAEMAEVILRCEDEGREKGYIPFSLYIKLADSFVKFKRAVDESEYARKVFGGEVFESVEEILKTVEIGWKISDIENGSLFQGEERREGEGIGEIGKQIKQWADVVGESIQDWRIMKDLKKIQIAYSSPLWTLFRGERKEMILSSEIKRIRRQIERIEKILSDEGSSLFDKEAIEKAIAEKAVEIESEVAKRVLSEVEGKIAGVEENLFSRVKEEIREYINSDEGKSILEEVVEGILKEKGCSGECVEEGYTEEDYSGEGYGEYETVEEKDVEDTTIREEIESINERITLLEGRVEKLENMFEEEEEREGEGIEEGISEEEKVDVEGGGEVSFVEETIDDVIEEVAKNIEEGGRIREAVEKVVEEKISEIKGGEGEEASIPEDVINSIKEDINYEVLSEVRRVLSSEVERVVEERVRDIAIRLAEIEEKLEKGVVSNSKEKVYEDSYEREIEREGEKQEREEVFEKVEEEEKEGEVEEGEEVEREDDLEDEEETEGKIIRGKKGSLGDIAKRVIIVLIPLVLLFLILMKLL